MEAEKILHQIFGDILDRGTPFLALSGSKGLRWIVPAQQPRIIRSLAGWHPYSLKARVGWHGIHVALRLGAGAYLPGAAQFSADLSCVDWRAFGWTNKTPPLIAFYVGTKGLQQKVVMILTDAHDGMPRMIIKIPLGLEAWAAIVHEYKMLEELRIEHRMHAPVPILINSEKRFAVQSSLIGSPVGVMLSSAHIQFLASLVQPGKTVSLETVRKQLTTQHARLAKKGVLTSDLEERIATLLDEDDWHGDIPAVRTHGDFAPWNLKRCDNGAIAAFDWEESKAESLPFFDLYYYQFQVKYLLGRRVHIAWDEYENALFGDMSINRTVITAASRAAQVAAALLVGEQNHGT